MSQVLDPPLTGPVTAAVGALRGAVNDLVRLSGAGPDAGLDAVRDIGPAGELWSLSSGELLEATAQLQRVLCQGDAVMHALVREVDVRGAAVEAGAVTTAGWLRGRLRLHPATARRLVDTARGLHDDPAGPLVHHALADQVRPQGRAALRAAFAAGDICGEHAQVACQTMTEITLLPGGLDPEVTERAEAFLVEQARLHDPKALNRLGRHLRHTLDPDGGDRLAQAEEYATATQQLELRDRRDGGAELRGRLGPELAAALRAHLGPLTAPRAAVEGVKDARSLPQRQADALAELLRRYARAQAGPTVHGAHTTVTVTMALETLERRLGAAGAWLDWSGPVSAETARRLACDARVIPVVLGKAGEPLDVGRASYEVTQGIWRALVARDGGCAFAGCDRPPEWCEAHHRTHWEDGGQTSVANCALLCDHHHRCVHHHGWRVELINGSIYTIPPPWVDPEQKPRRNIQRARLLDPAALATITDLDRHRAPPDDDHRQL